MLRCARVQRRETSNFAYFHKNYACGRKKRYKEIKKGKRTWGTRISPGCDHPGGVVFFFSKKKKRNPPSPGRSNLSYPSDTRKRRVQQLLDLLKQTMHRQNPCRHVVEQVVERRQATLVEEVVIIRGVSETVAESDVSPGPRLAKSTKAKIVCSASTTYFSASPNANSSVPRGMPTKESPERARSASLFVSSGGRMSTPLADAAREAAPTRSREKALESSRTASHEASAPVE